MSTRKSIARPTTKSIASYVRKNALGVKKIQRHQHEASESIREATFRGHHIVIRTTYHIQVDGVPVTGHLGVTDDGQVHYHSIPNASFASAVDLVKQLIAIFPEDFAGGGHGDHRHGGHMQMTKPRPKSTARSSRNKRAK